MITIVTLHASRFTLHASRFTLHVSRFTFHVSRFTFHLNTAPWLADETMRAYLAI
ncbi:hypothetical protein QUF80_20425 [Desulfococcaceae bacterium HSG8]|nr:hypothetical protein [Desulfococcaceae bacterium HSG8]